MRNILMFWWWPAFVALYPWALWPDGTHTITSSYLERYIFTAVAVVGWLLLLLTSPNGSLLSSVVNFLKSLRRSPPLLVALLFAVWTVVSSLLSLEPSVSLMGNIYDYSDAVVHWLLLSLIFTFVYLYYTKHDPRYVFYALIFTALALVFASAYEVITGDGFYFHIKAERHPMVGFLGYGHLAGFLAMALGLTLGMYPSIYILLVIFLFATGLGMTNNRASVLASFLAGLSTKRIYPIRHTVLVLLLIMAGVLTGWWIVKQSGGQIRTDLAKTGTLHTRLALWKIAFAGIRERPIAGWGGGQFYQHVSEVAGEEDLKVFLQSPDIDLLFHEGNVYLYRDLNGNLRMEKLYSWSAHDFILDMALDYGIVGALLYLLLVVLVAQNALKGNPAALAVFTYHIFLLLWPISIESVGVLWVLMALGPLPTGGPARLREP